MLFRISSVASLLNEEWEGIAALLGARAMSPVHIQAPHAVEGAVLLAARPRAIGMCERVLHVYELTSNPITTTPV
jgi:hypothetical protein